MGIMIVWLDRKFISNLIMQHNLNFIDLFCGGGFGARGAVSGGGKPLLAVDAWDLEPRNFGNS